MRTYLQSYSLRFLPILKRAAFIASALSLGYAGNSAAQTSVSGDIVWNKIYEVLSHPRCVNCHVGPDNRPRWSGPSYGLPKGEWKYHGMNINADDSRIGAETLTCSTCHQSENSDLLHGPPGAHIWALAPVEMEWLDKSSLEICQQIKDPARNGGRNIDQITDHIKEEHLVHWGWHPGPGREPAPYSREDTVKFFKIWGAAGAPCPGIN